MDYDWPGNVRELENIITRASVLAVGSVIGADDLRPWLDPGPVMLERHLMPRRLSSMSLRGWRDMERQG